MLYKLNFQLNWKFVKMTHHNTKLQLGGRKNIYKNIYADTTSKFASIRLLARWSGSVYKLMIHHWLLWFFFYVIIRYILTRVANVVAHHDELLTQWRYIWMSKLGTNIFLISTTSNYLRSSAVCKNRSSKSWLFWFSRWNIWKICVN